MVDAAQIFQGFYLAVRVGALAQQEVGFVDQLLGAVRDGEETGRHLDVLFLFFLVLLFAVFLPEKLQGRGAVLFLEAGERVLDLFAGSPRANVFNFLYFVDGLRRFILSFLASVERENKKRCQNQNIEILEHLFSRARGFMNKGLNFILQQNVFLL